MLLLGAIFSRGAAIARCGDLEPSPNQALADLAKQIIIDSIPPQYEKSDDWGHQADFHLGYHWVQRDGGWHLDKRIKRRNDGLWRKYSVRLIDPANNLQVRFTKARPLGEGRTAFRVHLIAKLWTDARQERWRVGVKGLNFHVEAEATVEVRLDVEIAVQPVADASFGTIELRPKVTDVNLRLVDLTLKKVDKIGGDLARELGNAVEDILAGELHKREGEVAKKMNAEIKKNKQKLTFSPSQIAEIGLDKIQALLGATETMTDDR
ncbi:MAG: hypothetical protein IT427_07080 [Pirellulales bacterium]|nr:hypothetical protein [Pirellulales bacterium]